LSLEIGTQIGDYQVLSQIGAGAHGEVYEAEHVITKRIDAIKVLSSGHSAESEEGQRFLRETQVQASLDHPNIAAVYNAFWTPHGLALVMELVRGEPLRSLLDRGRIPHAQGTGYVLDVLAGLTYAHKRGVVHRDVKPENIIVKPDGSVKLTDFGLAQSPQSPRLTQSGALAGSPCYMSPEQISGTLQVDERSDLYSTGVLLYELLTGRPPFDGDDGFGVMLAHQKTAPPPPIQWEPSIGPKLNAVVLRALEKDRTRRIQSAQEFRSELKEASGISGPPAAIAAAPPPVAATLPWRRLALATGMVASILTVAGMSAYFTLTRHGSAQATSPPTAVAPAVKGGMAESRAVSAGAQQTDSSAARPAPSPSDNDVPGGRTPTATARRPVTRKGSRRASAARSPATIPPADSPVFHLPAREVEKPPERVGHAAEVVIPPPPNPAFVAPETPLPPVATDSPTPVKRRNPVVRALGRIFGKRRTPEGPGAQPSNHQGSANSSVPATASPAKEP
jgi:serine/threonine-protein kinase